MNFTRNIFLFVFVFFCQLGVSAYGQDQQDKPKEKEKLTEEQKELITKTIENSRIENKKSAKENRIVFEQSRLNSEIRKKLGEAKMHMAIGLDSAGISAESEEILNWHDIAKTGLADSTRHLLTFQNLAVSKVIYHEILVRSQKRKEELEVYKTDLENILFDIDSLINNDNIYIVPENKEIETAFYVNTLLLVKEAGTVQELLQKNINGLNDLFAILGVVIYDAESKVNLVDQLQSDIWSKKNLRENANYDFADKRTIQKTIQFSKKKISLALKIFYTNHRAILILFVLIFGVLFFYLRMLKKNYLQAFEEERVDRFLFLKKPLITSLFISIVIIQLLNLRFPFVIYSLGWSLCILLLYSIIQSKLDRSTKYWFIAVSLAMFLAYTDNLLLMIFDYEPLIISFLIAMVLAISIYGFLKIKEFGGFPLKLMQINFVVAFILQLVGIYGLISHNYNLSKKMTIAGIFIIVIFLGVIYVSRYLYQIFYISLEVYKRSDVDGFTVDRNKLELQLPKSVKLLAQFIGLALFLNTFYFFQRQFEPFVEFFTMQRKIGSLEFSFSSVILFFLIIYIAVLISKIVSFLLGESYIVKEKLKNTRHKNISNSLLLFRIGIITLGVIIAFASSGIPIDRLTMIISALGVGIGFGLQTLVNNLVSGIIIAFEKPINVGDVIDVAGKMGVMKSIGIRSSKMTTWDGSDVVIPNGDLLNQHLVNWTLGDSRARFEVEVGVAYGADLEEVNEAIKELLASYKSILKHPQPVVLFNQFGSSSIDIAIKFWVADFADGFAVRSDFIIAIDKMFKEKGFEIPFPQQDVYIKSLPSNDTDEQST